MNRVLERGEKIRLKKKLPDGWKGIGIVLRQSGDIVYFFKSGDPEGKIFGAMRCEVSAERKPR